MGSINMVDTVFIYLEISVLLVRIYIASHNYISIFIKNLNMGNYRLFGYRCDIIQLR